jgi:hypothetical protein
MKNADLFNWGLQQYIKNGKGMVVNPTPKHPLKYIPENDRLLSQLDQKLINEYNPETQIVLCEPVNPENLQGLWKTGIMTQQIHTAEDIVKSLKH